MSGRGPILVIFPYEDEYGPFRTLRFVLKAFAAGGFTPVCVVPADSPACRRLEELGVDVRPVSGLTTFPRTLNPLHLSSFLTQHLRVAGRIRRIADETRAELVYSMSEAIFCGSLAATRAGISSIVHVIGLSIGSPAWSATFYIRGLERLTSHFVACSSAVAEMLERYNVPEDRITVVHSGVSVQDIDATSSMPSPIDHPGPKIGMVAAYDERKGHELFVESAALLAQHQRNARFYIIGGVLQHQGESVAFFDHIQELIRKLGIEDRVISVGHVAAEEVYSWIRSLDVFVLPSRTEAFGYVQFEAMACSRPVIATRVEGNLDAFIDDHSGIYVGRSPEEMSAAVARLIEDPALARRLGAAGRERVTRFFDERRVVSALIQTLETTLARDANARPQSAAEAPC
jgi:glycosyltransferase involved in cell wall biosynthesis